MLPQKLPWELAQTIWATQLNPLIANPMANGVILKSVQLTSGTNIVNHKLQRKLQGWYITRMRDVAASIYDTQDTNNYSELTLALVSSTPVVVDILVF
jgi:hypothetical protein